MLRFCQDFNQKQNRTKFKQINECQAKSYFKFKQHRKCLAKSNTDFKQNQTRISSKIENIQAKYWNHWTWNDRFSPGKLRKGKRAVEVCFHEKFPNERLRKATPCLFWVKFAASCWLTCLLSYVLLFCCVFGLSCVTFPYFVLICSFVFASCCLTVMSDDTVIVALCYSKGCHKSCESYKS